MELIRLRDSRGKIFDTAMKLYEKSFPKYERRSYDAQQRAMYDEQFHFDLIYDEGEFIGEVLYWNTDSFIYIVAFYRKSATASTESAHSRCCKAAIKPLFWKSTRRRMKYPFAVADFMSETDLN